MISVVLQEAFELFPCGTIFECLIHNKLADRERMHTTDLHGPIEFIEIKYFDNHQFTTAGAINISTEKRNKAFELI